MLEKQSSTQRKGETVPQCTDSSLNSQHWARLMPEGKKSILSSMYSDHLPLPFKVKTGVAGTQSGYPKIELSIVGGSLCTVPQC